MSKILKIRARQVFDSRGTPTIEAEIYSKNLSASAICPSGASTGTYEAFEKRDKDNKKYLGKSVFSAINLINTKISKKLKGTNIHNQARIDTILINLDGTRQKTNLGANSILAVSMAAKKLSSKIKKIPLYKNFLVKKNFKLPYPLMNIINGGAHANNGLRIQEFMIRPDKAKSFSEAMRICFVVIDNLRKLIIKKGLSTSVGDEGGFAPMIKNNEKALTLIVTAIKKSGFKNGRDISICLDVAANELCKNNKYSVHSKKFISTEQTIKEYKKIIKKYKIKSIEDPFAENDWTSWSKMMKSIKKGLSTSVGDEGGFAPMISNNEKALALVVAAIKKSGFKNGRDISICLDIAANELYKNNKYSVHSKKFISIEQTIKEYKKIIKKYKIKSIEDPFAENDWTAWSKMMKSIKNVQIVGDDLYVTNLERLKKGFLYNSTNSILIKLNQIGTVSETLEVIKFAQIIGYKTIISHRSGDSEDTFIADLAVGTNSNQIKTGSLARSERVAKYNQLLRIEEELGKRVRMNKIH